MSEALAEAHPNQAAACLANYGSGRIDGWREQYLESYAKVEKKLPAKHRKRIRENAIKEFDLILKALHLD